MICYLSVTETRIFENLKMKLILLTCTITLPLFLSAQAEECDWKDIERLADKIKDSIVHSPGHRSVEDTTRELAALYLTLKFESCLKGKEMHHIEQLLGKGCLRKNDDPLSTDYWTYKLEYVLNEYLENGGEIMNGIPSGLYFSFDEKKRVLDCYIISY